jgi:hypothetical protein
VLLFIGEIRAQSFYRTINGYVFAIGLYSDSSFFAESHKLAISYDPVSKSIYGDLNLQTFVSGIPLIDSILTAKTRKVTLSGFIPVDFLTWDHNEYNLDVPLEIIINDIKVSTLAKMRFSHVDRLLNYTCIMEASFSLHLNDFNISIPEQVGSDISVQFLQLILRKERR